MTTADLIRLLAPRELGGADMEQTLWSVDSRDAPS